MLENAILSARSAAVFFDFATAFPAIAHAWLFMVLRAIGVPPNVLLLIAALYADCEALIVLNGQVVNMFSVASGIKQGCPLSGTIFALAIDPLIRALTSRIITPPSLLSAYADDLAIVLNDLFRQLPFVIEVLRYWARASALHLNVPKCTVVPLWRAALDEVRGRLRRAIPWFAACAVEHHARYLGIALGPGAQHHLWEGALARFAAAASRVRLADRGLATKFLQFSAYATSTLAYKLQFHAPTAQLSKAFEVGAQRILRRPWNAIPCSMLHRLPGLGFPQGIACLASLSLASRTRVVVASASYQLAVERLAAAKASDDRLLYPYALQWREHSVLEQLRAAHATTTSLASCRRLLLTPPTGPARQPPAEDPQEDWQAHALR